MSVLNRRCRRCHRAQETAEGDTTNTLSSITVAKTDPATQAIMTWVECNKAKTMDIIQAVVPLIGGVEHDNTIHLLATPTMKILFHQSSSKDLVLVDGPDIQQQLSIGRYTSLEDHAGKL